MVLLGFPSSVGPYAAVMAVGLVIGVYGHVIKSRPLILVGIVIIGGINAYFVLRGYQVV